MEKKEWFSTWFDTKYYHILYQSRNDEEAEAFITKLFSYLSLEKGAKVLDLACGKGRHAKTMASKGVSVIGADLSPQSIAFAKQFEREGLEFLVHDMREELNHQFNAVFNLFTSFGYFDDMAENARVVQAVNAMLSEGGFFIIDFMNASKVVKGLVINEEKIIDGIRFEIERKFDGKHIFKHIKFEDGGEKFEYTERVQFLCEDDFRNLLTLNGFKLNATFGNFDLDPFNVEESDRLILVAQKIK